MTLVAGETQTHDYYMTIGPMFADPVARQLYAEIASIEEQHVTHYESMMDPTETWLEKWLMKEACEVYNYYSCLEYETNPRVRLIWEQMLSYELGHLALVRNLFEKVERRDAAEVLPATLPAPIEYESHRKFVREVLTNEVHLRAVGTEIVDPRETPETAETLAYRKRINASGSPSETVAAGWVWSPGTEVAAKPQKQPQADNIPEILS
jgi:rubrerythrin